VSARPTIQHPQPLSGPNTGKRQNGRAMENAAKSNRPPWPAPPRADQRSKQPFAAIVTGEKRRSLQRRERKLAAAKIE